MCPEWTPQALIMSGIKKGADPDIFIHHQSIADRTGAMHSCAPERIRTLEHLTGDARISALCKHFASHATRRISLSSFGRKRPPWRTGPAITMPSALIMGVNRQPKPLINA